MNKVKSSHKVIALFLTINFLTTLLPGNYILANNNGPGSPEAAGFEPVDATDMVNLTNGNLSYVLPLMNVEGFPVTLSYHAGITTDMDASWAGLGWYINPGAINRSVTNTPDDWKSGVGLNFTSFYQETNYYGVSVEVGFPGAASVGVGMNWGGGQGLSGSVSANLGLGAGTAGLVQGGISAGASTTGDAFLGAGIGVDVGPVSVGVGLSYSLQNQWSLSGGVAAPVGDKGAFVGAGMSTNGGFSINGAGNNNAKGKNVGGNSGGVGMSSDSFSQGDASIDTQNTGIAVPLHFVGIPITLGFRKQKVKINIKKGYLNQEWGALYSSDFGNISSGNARITEVRNPNLSNYDEHYLDYMVRTKSMDTYSTRLPQPEEEFISDYSKAIENINFTHMGYDDYNVAAQGIMGSMTPHMFKNASIYGKGQVTKNEAGQPIHAFWHHGQIGSAVNRQLGRITSNSVGTYTNNDIHFYFNGQFTSTEKNSVVSLSTSSINTVTNFDALINEGSHSGTSINNTYQGRAKSPNYIEVFTNRQIKTGHASARGLITPATIPNSDRDDIAKFDPDGIGAYKVTAPDGKTYHFALPVYHYEQIHRGQINSQEDVTFNIGNVTEKRQFSRYATHWLLTAIAGSDYIDRPDPSSGNAINTFNKEDYGYWVELEYGKWSDGFVWRDPYKDRTYNYNTNTKGDIEEKDKGSYSFGRKQLYYLDKINTKNRTALFIKELRTDGFGKELRFRYSNSGITTIGHTGNGMTSSSLNYTNPNLYVKENRNNIGVNYKREYALKLSKIVLVDGDIGKHLSKITTSNISSNLASTYGRFGNTYVPNDTCIPNWESPYFSNEYGSGYSYGIHNESQVLDLRDIPINFIQDHALKVVELNHSYDLAKNSPSSSEVSTANNPSKGKLTLDAVHFKGKGGADYMPATTFDYYMKDFQNLNLPNPVGNQTAISAAQIQTYVENRKSSVDSWGFLQGNHLGKNKAMAWSLKEITMPTGARIEIDYEEDDYWIEAFSRRYWENNGLEVKFTQEGQQKYIYFKQNFNEISNETIDFTKYFNSNEKAFVDVHYWRNPSRGSAGHRVADFSGGFDIAYVTPGEIKIQLPQENSSAPREGITCGSTPWAYTAYYSGSFSTASVVQRFANYQSSMGDGSCGWPGGDGSSRFNYKLLANKVPEDETGGGLRVKELITVDGTNIYKVQYDYSHPTENRSSGITSYAPVDGLKFVPYQTELPAPGVMYEYVTMKQTSNTGEYYSKTRYRHHVLKPVFNIFNPNISMEALDADAVGEDNIFWANVTDNYNNFDGSNSKNIKAKKIDIHVNTALLGQIKSIENINSEGHIMMKTENEYINGAILSGERANNDGQWGDAEPNKGYTRETFNSMKTIFQTNNNGTQIQDVKRLLSVSSRTDYNNLLKKTNTYAGGQSTSVTYDDVDPWLGSFRKSETEFANGIKKVSYRVPAYEKYPDMQSRVLDHVRNKNMLTQEAMSIDEYNGKTLNASITTWNDTWIYTDAIGNQSTESGVWRKHKNFVWKDNLNTDGTYATQITPTSSYFNWGLGIPTNSKWQNVSEITKYTHWSMPIETRDIDTNFVASKMADNFSKVIASGNARHGEILYSGAEHQASGNIFDGDIEGANYMSNQYAHTGNYSIKITNPNSQFFKVTGSVGSGHNDLTKDFRPGIYKVSVWTLATSKGDQVIKLVKNGTTIAPNSGEILKAGNWVQFNYNVTLQANSDLSLYFTTTDINNIPNGRFYDDFRMHPIASSMNSYVYDKTTDELIAILDNNNLATLYCYDTAGRLCATYTEVVNPVGTTSGGFKVTGKNRYKYKNYPENNSCGCTF